MYSQEEVRNKPKWRRVVLAGLLAAPVVTLSSLAGEVAAAPPVFTLEAGCKQQGSDSVPYISVVIDTDLKVSVEIDGVLTVSDKGASSPLLERMFYKGQGNGKTPLVVGTTYVVKVTVGGEFASDSIMASCTTPEPEDLTSTSVTKVCSGPNRRGIRIEFSNGFDGSAGPPYDLYVSAAGEDVDLDGPPTWDNQKDFIWEEKTGSGTFQIIIKENGNAEGKSVYNDYINVSCRRSSGGTTVTTPPLPSTGSDSSTSLLILAPAMMALGGGLVLARRRMVKA